MEWDETFAGALEKLIGKKTSEKGSTVRPGSVAEMVGGNGTGVLSGDNLSGERDIPALAKLAQELYDAVQEAQRQGNWALYGDKIQELWKGHNGAGREVEILMFTILFGALAVIVLVLMCFGIYIFAAYVFSPGLGRSSG